MYWKDWHCRPWEGWPEAECIVWGCEGQRAGGRTLKSWGWETEDSDVC